jgi:membrane protein EpsK
MKTARNVGFSILGFAANVLSTFFLVPLIERTMGLDAYGYIAVALSLVSVMSIVSMAVTSMTARFVVKDLIRGNVTTASRYFNSALLGSIILVCFIILVSIIAIFNIERLVNVDTIYVGQLQCLLTILTLSFCLAIVSTPFLIGYVAKNEMWITYIFSAASQLTRLIAACILFNAYVPQIWFPYLGSLAIDLLAFFYYLKNWKRNCPQLTISKAYCSLGSLKDILKSGVWVSLSRGGQVLLGLVNSYLANLLFSAYLVGIYATTVQIQTAVVALSGAAAGAFFPVLLQAFAKNDIPHMALLAKRAIRYLGILVGLLSGCLFAFSDSFFQLWVNMDTSGFESMVAFMMVLLPLACSADILGSIFATANKVRFSALATVGSGVLNVALVLVFCAVFDYGLPGLAFAQLLSSVFRALILFVPYGAALLKERIGALCRSIAVAPFTMILTIAVCYSVQVFFQPDTWLQLIVIGGSCALVALITNGFLFTSKDERQELVKMVIKPTKNV